MTSGQTAALSSAALAVPGAGPVLAATLPVIDALSSLFRGKTQHFSYPVVLEKAEPFGRAMYAVWKAQFTPAQLSKIQQAAAANQQLYFSKQWGMGGILVGGPGGFNQLIETWKATGELVNAQTLGTQFQIFYQWVWQNVDIATVEANKQTFLDLYNLIFVDAASRTGALTQSQITAIKINPNEPTGQTLPPVALGSSLQATLANPLFIVLALGAAVYFIGGKKGYH